MQELAKTKNRRNELYTIENYNNFMQTKVLRHIIFGYNHFLYLRHSLNIHHWNMQPVHLALALYMSEKRRVPDDITLSAAIHDLESQL